MSGGKKDLVGEKRLAANLNHKFGRKRGKKYLAANIFSIFFICSCRFINFSSGGLVVPMGATKPPEEKFIKNLCLGFAANLFSRPNLFFPPTYALGRMCSHPP